MQRAAKGILLAVLLLVILGLNATVASAGGSVKTILSDASDGVVDGSYSAAQVRAALAVVRRDPAYMQYSDIEGVLADYLGTLGGTGDSDSSQQTGGSDSSQQIGGTDSSQQTSGSDATPGQAETSGQKNETPRATHESPGSSSGATPLASGSAEATATPVSRISGWERVKVRLAAVPWLFAVVAVGLVTGVVLLRRRRTG